MAKFIKNVILVTRCTRPDNLPKMFPSIRQMSEIFKKKNINLDWAIGIDLYRGPQNIPEFERYCRECKEYGVNAIWCGAYKSFNEKDFGCTVATYIINGYCNKTKEENIDNSDVNLVYLLDDDNILHDNFDVCIFNASDISPTIWNIDWFGNTIKPMQFLLLNDERFCKGIDAAQFVIPFNLLKTIDWYSGGWKIDFSTLSKAINQCKSYKILDIVGAKYNAIPSKRYYDEMVEHPHRWFDDTNNRVIKDIVEYEEA